MRILYNIIQLGSLVFLLPVMVLLALFSSKYQKRIPQRLGVGLNVPSKQKEHPRIWIHALSVGEAISAKPLVKALRKEIPECELLFSSSTQGGQLVAQDMTDDVDHFIAFPFDFFFIVKKFIKHIQPDAFVLVETDLWPNVIWQLTDHGTPCVLVNGRIAKKSFERYLLFKPLFASFFNSFAALAMQMDSGVAQLEKLGVDPARIKCFGNLKFDLKLHMKDAPDLSAVSRHFKGRTIIVAGSTHRGEEEIVLSAFGRMAKGQDKLLLIIAPRNVERAQEVQKIAEDMGLLVNLRTEQIVDATQVIILNTIGELVYLYHFADLAFVGGSLVDERGHNPLEPAYWGKPVVYGPYMDDFWEASQGLIDAGAGQKAGVDTFHQTIEQLVSNSELCKAMGANASKFVVRHQGAARQCSLLIKEIMDRHVS